MACKISTYLDIPWDEVMCEFASASGTEIFVMRDPCDPLNAMNVTIKWPSGYSVTLTCDPHDIAYNPKEFGEKMRELTQLRLVPK